ncbi:hypothetical protein LCGC14_0925820 [marine sediment metagenome]|uniref:DUF551 domain-containing protein n=1 Tax=marine sediment metagenome TaxID=412755 RepID=A0A0F9PA95_9ZZZZ
MKWISIRKQKPPLDTKVLIFQRFKHGSIIKIGEYVEIPNKKLSKFGSRIQREEDGIVCAGYPLDNVTHWMPLPEPPISRPRRISFLARRDEQPAKRVSFTISPSKRRKK